VVNVDDPKGAELAKRLKDVGEVALWTVSSKGEARLKARAIRHGIQGLSFDVMEGDELATLHSNAVGDYNVDNLLAVLAALRSLGYPLSEGARACSQLPSVPGRMELHSAERGPKVFVDYAHTPDALHKALAALRPLAEERRGKLIVVFGCGGQRDRTKRPLMGSVAIRNSDHVILTSDNPRGEPPYKIMQEIQEGTPPGASIELWVDRSKAIHRAIDLARAEDVVLVAGKGHETYQESSEGKLPFSDQEEARKALLAWRVGAGSSFGSTAFQARST
jgi:UDP-N-acetylmuramoyl-L-alanyl-D-glutamate--2,6-diaminopimelate ligase